VPASGGPVAAAGHAAGAAATRSAFSWADFRAAVRGYPTRAFVICLVGAAFANMDQALFAFVLTQMSQEFGWTVVERGWYLALTFSIAGLSIAGLGVLTDRIGRKRVFQASILISSLLVAALRWAPNTAWLLTLRTLGFATGGIQSPVTGTIVVEESPARYRGLLSGSLQIGYPIGWFLASLMAPPLLAGYGWRSVFLIGLISIPYMWIVGRSLREPEAFVRAKATEKARGESTTFTELLGPVFRRRTLLLFWGEFLHVFAYGATILLTSYFQESRGWSPADAIGIVGLSYAVGALGYVLAACVGEFVLPRRDAILVWSSLGTLAMLALLWLAESYTATVTAYCAMTVFFYGTTAVKFTYIAENYPARLRASGVTLAGSLAVNLGVAFGPLALSYLVRDYGWPLAFTVAGALPLAASGLFFLGLPRHPVVATDETRDTVGETTR
jgi:putative MFS transporter